jgi:maltooligosyltrehalose trehalohydrolase
MHVFTVWAPRSTRVDLVLPSSPQTLAMERRADGWWTREVGTAGHGTDYWFGVDGADPAPDPRSAWQPHGVHGPSRIFDAGRYGWSDDAWPGRNILGAVFYELHVGTFTPEGTLDAAVDHLDHLVGLGVDVVELMPVAAFPGRHGWGYDGVHLYAVHDSYGGPEGLQRFVDACHARGLAVCLDVVYNHLGPSGNYLHRYGPYFTDRHHTPWGQAINLDDDGSDQVRRWICDNALRWMEDFHVDCLRLDAVHALVDDSPRHLLAQLADEVRALSDKLGTPLSLVAESDLNDPRTVEPTAAGGLGMTAQWSDDFHHALHTLLTGEQHGYYSDFGSPEVLARTLTEVFRHAGDYSSFRGTDWGVPVDPDRHAGHRFLGYRQNHDQVGNRAHGDRMSDTVSPGLIAAGAALVLTSPFTPMLFMGEEWAAGTPWQFFTDFDEPDLAEAVRRGRRAEFASHGWHGEVPDPQDPATRDASVLDWSEPEREPHRGVLAWYHDLIALRRATPELRDDDLARVQVSTGDHWLVLHRGTWDVAVNLAEYPLTLPAREGSQVVLAWDEAVVDGTAVTLGPGSVALLRAS